MRLPERRLWRAPLSFIAAAFVAVLPLHRVSGATNLGLLPNGEAFTGAFVLCIASSA